jgi:hypothetical protein
MMKIGDLVKMQFRGNGHPGVGVIYSVDESIGHEDSVVCKCLWDMPMWNNTAWHEHELVVINESR